MVAVEAHWLHNLPGWNVILSEDKRKELTKAFKNSKTIVKEAQAEQIIEKSRFIAYVKPVETKEAGFKSIFHLLCVLRQLN